MHKKFEINRTKIKGSCQSGRKVVTQNSKIDLSLDIIRKTKALGKTNLEKIHRNYFAGNIVPIYCEKKKF